ncbi:MAG TPA: hypothetical protein DIU11_14470 [Pusillimonas sp.]|nr:hypothetical protein [Pusillimonas sp.]
MGDSVLRGADIRCGGRGRQADLVDKMSQNGMKSLHLLRKMGFGCAFPVLRASGDPVFAGIAP